MYDRQMKQKREKKSKLLGDDDSDEEDDERPVSGHDASHIRNFHDKALYTATSGGATKISKSLKHAVNNQKRQAARHV